MASVRPESKGIAAGSGVLAGFLVRNTPVRIAITPTEEELEYTRCLYQRCPIPRRWEVVFGDFLAFGLVL